MAEVLSGVISKCTDGWRVLEGVTWGAGIRIVVTLLLEGNNVFVSLLPIQFPHALIGGLLSIIGLLLTHWRGLKEEPQEALQG